MSVSSIFRLLYRHMLFISLVLTGSVSASAQPADEELRALYEREWSWWLEQSAQVRDARGELVRGDRWPAVDRDTQAERLAYWEVVLAELHQWEFGLIAVVTAITFLGRGVTVLGLTAGYNCAAPPHKRTSLRSQAVMTAAGLRGGTAYALAMRWDGDAGRIGPVETLTMGGFASAGGGRVVGREFLFALWQTPPDPRSAP